MNGRFKMKHIKNEITTDSELSVTWCGITITTEDYFMNAERAANYGMHHLDKIICRECAEIILLNLLKCSLNSCAKLSIMPDVS